MSRLVLVAIVMAISSTSGVAQAADAPKNPWHDSREPRPAPSFDIPDEVEMTATTANGSRIIAGTELIPNTMVGVGMFGEKAEKSPLAPSVGRELAIPKSRKAAVGLSFKF